MSAAHANICSKETLDREQAFVILWGTCVRLLRRRTPASLPHSPGLGSDVCRTCGSPHQRAVPFSPPTGPRSSRRHPTPGRSLRLSGPGPPDDRPSGPAGRHRPAASGLRRLATVPVCPATRAGGIPRRAPRLPCLDRTRSAAACRGAQAHDGAAEPPDRQPPEPSSGQPPEFPRSQAPERSGGAPAPPRRGVVRRRGGDGLLGWPAGGPGTHRWWSPRQHRCARRSATCRLASMDRAAGRHVVDDCRSGPTTRRRTTARRSDGRRPGWYDALSGRGNPHPGHLSEPGPQLRRHGGYIRTSALPSMRRHG